MRIILKYITLILTLVFSLTSSAQSAEGVKISNDVSIPNPSTMFEVVSDNKGVLFTQVALTSIFDYAPVLGVETNGVMVYNTNSIAYGSCGEGYYYWSGDFWEKIGEQCIPHMTFAEMIDLTSSLSSYNQGFEVFIIDTNIPTTNISGINTCSPSNFNPNGVWTFINTPQTHPQIGNCIKWTTNINFPVFQCTNIGIQCP